MKQHTHATQEEIRDALSHITPEHHSVMGYSRDEQISFASEVVRRTGKSVRMNGMTIHPSKPVSFGEKLFQAVVSLVAFGFIALMVLALLVAIASTVAG